VLTSLVILSHQSILLYPERFPRGAAKPFFSPLVFPELLRERPFHGSFSRHSPLGTRHFPLSLFLPAHPENQSVTPVESALPKSLDLKSFRIRTYGKHTGVGVLLLTRRVMKHVYPERPLGVDGPLSHPLKKWYAPAVVGQWARIPGSFGWPAFGNILKGPPSRHSHQETAPYGGPSRMRRRCSCLISLRTPPMISS
jgi:hypothetical protein